jgi:hypothetical protein
MIASATFRQLFYVVPKPGVGGSSPLRDAIQIMRPAHLLTGSGLRSRRVTAKSRAVLRRWAVHRGNGEVCPGADYDPADVSARRVSAIGVQRTLFNLGTTGLERSNAE